MRRGKVRAGESLAPSAALGALFGRVQAVGLFADSKTFADMVPRGDTAAIAARAPGDDASLATFVAANFDSPAELAVAPPLPGLGLREHVRALWPALTRLPVAAVGSALAVGRPHVVPGGRFRELYYWDSYFTMLGLARDAPALVEDMLDVFADLIEQFGHIPNGTRSYYVGRSQPPFFALMLGLSPRGRDPRRLAAARREYQWWMAERATSLPGGATLNRYDGGGDTPRDESWREDVATAAASARPAAEVWRDLRAGAESGWDYSSRWLGDGRTLATIRTTRIVPVDLNALLYASEVVLGLDAAAKARRAAIDRHLWAGDRYADLDLDRGPTPHLTAATLAPLFAGCASQAQADAVARTTEARLLAPGGLRTTLVESGEQWDAPNGWAPLQWIAIAGLRRYGHAALAHTIADRWLATVSRVFDKTGRLYEKYDVERGTAGGGGEYAVQDGFGWTNGVTAALLDER